MILLKQKIPCLTLSYVNIVLSNFDCFFFHCRVIVYTNLSTFNYSTSHLRVDMSKNAPPSEKNKKVWSSNLVRFQEGKSSRKHTTTESLNQMHGIPQEQQILDRYKTLASRIKSKKERIVVIAGEVREVWKKLNLPIQQGKSTVERKLDNVIQKYEKHKRRPGNYDFTKLFDVTNEKGEWLCKEDKEFYELQLSTKGKVGYCTTKEDIKGIHPRKLKLLKRKATVTEEFADDSTEETSEIEGSTSEEEFSSGSEGLKKTNPKRQKTDSVLPLVTTAKLSTRKAHKVCKTLSDSGISLPTPTQSGLYKAVLKQSEELKKKFMTNLKNEHWCLHFDGKTIQKKEYQVIVLKNETREIRLAVLELTNGKGETIFNGVKTVLDNYQLWPAIKMIVSDTNSSKYWKMPWCSHTATKTL